MDRNAVQPIDAAIHSDLQRTITLALALLMRSFSLATRFFQPLADSLETRLSQRGSSSDP